MATSVADIEGIINYDLLLLAAWAKQWLIKFNPLKTEAILLTLRQFEALPNFIFENVQLRFVDYHKHLGVTLSSKGQLHNHFEKIVKSATKIVGVMRKLKNNLSKIALNQMFISYVFPILEYSSLVWDGCTQHDTNTLEKITTQSSKTCSTISLSGKLIQSNLNSSNTDGSFTMVNSTSFLSPFEILPIAQENKYRPPSGLVPLSTKL